MDEIDKKILDIIQTGFPLESRPYEVVGRMLRLTETEVLAKVRVLKEKGIIRRIGATFDSRKLGFHSTLCAARVPEDKLERFTTMVNELPGVTHNYLRDDDYNVWFTLIGLGEEAVHEILRKITARTGIEVLNLPAEKVYKIKVDFKMNQAEK